MDDTNSMGKSSVLKLEKVNTERINPHEDSISDSMNPSYRHIQESQKDEFQTDKAHNFIKS